MYNLDKIESRVSPLANYRRYVSFLHDEWIDVGKFSCARPIGDKLRLLKNVLKFVRRTSELV